MIKQKPHLAKFVAISILLHLLGIYVYHITPEKVIESLGAKPIKIKFVPPELKEPEAPKPAILEPSQTEKFIANIDSRAHSNQKKKKTIYQNGRTALHAQAEKRVAAAKPFISKPSFAKKLIRKRVKKRSPEKKHPVFKQTAKGRMQPKQQKTTEEASAVKSPGQPIGAMAMLNGFDANKYASLNTNTMDDDKPISLDTKETKYADYFSRVKFQIEQVWIYPLEAARRGISGQTTLKFKLSREGNLVDISLVKSSGTRTLDEAASQAVKKAAPYYPFPANINKVKITILATFIYSPNYSNNSYSYQ